MKIDIFSLYDDLRKYFDADTVAEYDDLFYDAPEGDAQISIIKEMLEKIADNI